METEYDLLGKTDVEVLSMATGMSMDGVLRESGMTLSGLEGADLSHARGRRLRALAEAARRVFKRQEWRSMPMQDSKAVYEFMVPYTKGEKRERVFVLLLDARSRLIQEPCCVSVGSLMSSVIHPREVFRPAIQAAAAAVILVHNHPSGDPTPSVEDHRVTVRLAEAGALLGIRLIDHLVVADEGFRSFKGEGWLPERW